MPKNKQNIEKEKKRNKNPIKILLNMTQKLLSKDCFSYIYTLFTLGAFNKFPDFFVLAFKIVVDSW